MDRIRAASFAALFTITLTSLASAQRQEIATVSPDSALDSNIVARDSTRAVVAEVAGHVQLDQARLDSLESSLTDAREAAPHDADATRRAAEGVKGGRKSVAHDVRRTRHERELLAELEKKVDAEQAALSARSTLSVDPGSAGHR